MIGPFSTTLIPLSSSSSVDRQVLINVKKNLVLSLQKYLFTRRSDEEKKSLDQIARTFSLFAPPQTVLAPAATAYKYTTSTLIFVYFLHKVYFKIYLNLT